MTMLASKSPIAITFVDYCILLLRRFLPYLARLFFRARFFPLRGTYNPRRRTQGNPLFREQEVTPLSRTPRPACNAVDAARSS